MLAVARANLDRAGIAKAQVRLGDIHHLPFARNAFDVVTIHQVLHYLDDPERAIAEAARVLRPGGRLLVLDLREHDEPWVRTRFGDRWLGFSDTALEGLLAGAGVGDVRVQVGARQSGDPFVVLIASGTKPEPPKAHSRKPKAE